MYASDQDAQIGLFQNVLEYSWRRQLDDRVLLCHLWRIPHHIRQQYAWLTAIEPDRVCKLRLPQLVSSDGEWGAGYHGLLLLGQGQLFNFHVEVSYQVKIISVFQIKISCSNLRSMSVNFSCLDQFSGVGHSNFQIKVSSVFKSKSVQVSDQDQFYIFSIWWRLYVTKKATDQNDGGIRLERQRTGVQDNIIYTPRGEVVNPLGNHKKMADVRV